MHELDDILLQATAAISGEYFLLPVHGADPVHRERVYCYELYHQMRLRWPAPEDCTYRLNGEIDKGGHPYFGSERVKPKPDLLVHVPGTGDNYAVIEVKSSRSKAKEVQKRPPFALPFCRLRIPESDLSGLRCRGRVEPDRTARRRRDRSD
jgi:hypothetical protein